jgi:hypothetical protein
MTSTSKLDSQATLRFNAEKFNPLIGLFLLLFVAIASVAIWGYFKGKGIFWEGPSMMFAPLAIFYVAFSGWRVEISREDITVVTFFWFRKTVRRAAITNWAIKTGWKAGDRIKDVPYNRLEIYTDKQSQPFMIPIKALSRENIKKLTEQLPPKKETASS